MEGDYYTAHIWSSFFRLNWSCLQTTGIYSPHKLTCHITTTHWVQSMFLCVHIHIFSCSVDCSVSKTHTPVVDVQLLWGQQSCFHALRPHYCSPVKYRACWLPRTIRADDIYSQHPLHISDLEYIYHRSASPTTSTGHLLNNMIPPAPLRDRNWKRSYHFTPHSTGKPLGNNGRM